MTDSSIRIVLCHAHIGLRTGLRHMLEATDGFDVVAAVGRGEEGVEAAERLAPDVVLMDLAMPRIDAVATSRRIAALQPRPRILVFTAFPHPTRIRAAMDAGASGYVLKDSTPAALVHALRWAGEQAGAGAAR